MASGSGPWLLTVAVLVAAWISDIATAWPSSEQAGTSQKSISCLPCSRMHVADAYLDSLTGQLAQHRDLTEISDSANLCKGLADDLDVPTLSDLHRQLVGEVFLDVAVFGDTNLEIPSALSNRSAVEIHFDLRPSTSVNCNLAIELPLHARYPPLDASGYAKVEFSSPDLLLRYRKKEIHSDPCLWVLKNLDAAAVEKVAWRIPCGDEAHIGFVSSITFLSALVCSMSIVLAALIF